MKNNACKRFLAGFLATVMVLLMFPVGAIAGSAEETEGDAQVSLWETEDYGDGVAVIKYNGSAADVYVPSTISVEGIDRKVVKLGDGLFADNDGLNSVTLAEGITEIGARAFYDADALVCIVTNETLAAIGDEAFYGCDRFNSIILPDSLTEIGENAFAECLALTVWCNGDSCAYSYAAENGLTCKVIQPSATPETVELNGVTYYIQNGEAIVIDCAEDATNVTIPSVINGYPVTELRETFREHANLTDITLSQGIKKIGDYAFYKCTALKSVSIPEGVISVGKYAFSLSTSLETVKLPESLTSLGAYAFSECKYLASVNIPKGLQRIEDYTFNRCFKMKDVTIPYGVTYIGSHAFDNCDTLTGIYIPGSVKTIGSYAFNDCSGVKNINLSNGVESIGSSAFSQCGTFQSIVIPASVKSVGRCAFHYNRYVRSVTIQQGATAIGERMFEHCDELRSVTIPSSIQTIPYGAFSYCRYLKNVTLPETGLTTIASAAFTECPLLQTMIIPQTVTSIGAPSFPDSMVFAVYENSYAHTYVKNRGSLFVIYDGVNAPEIIAKDGITYFIQNSTAIAIDCTSTLTSITIPEKVNDYPVVELRETFKNCTKIQKITLPEGLNTIGEDAFYHCTALKSVNIPSTVKKIGYYAFYECSSLTSIVLPDGVETLEAYAFGYCTKLESVTLSSSLTEISTNVFLSCKALKNIEIPESVTTIGTGSFSHCISFTEVKLPEKLTSLGSFSFAYCSNLKRINIPEGVTTLQSQTFYECPVLESITIPSGVKSIGYGAFYNCAALKSLTFPAGVTYLGSYVCYGCANLENVTFFSGVSIDKYSFYNCSKLNSVALVSGGSSIGSYAFDGCTELTSLLIPQTVTSIQKNSFAANIVLVVYENSYAHTFAKNQKLLYMVYDGENLPIVFTIDGLTYVVQDAGAIVVACDETLTSVTVPSTVNGYSVIQIREAFKNRTNLKSVTLSEGIKTIGANSFYGCTALTTVTLSSSLVGIGASAFYGCSKLEFIEIPDGVSMADRVFFECVSLKSVALPSKLIRIGDYTFYKCEKLESVVVPDGVTDIGMGAFAYCYALKEAVIPDTVKSFGQHAFRDCVSLEKINIPTGFVAIQNMVFFNCSSLTHVTIPNGVTMVLSQVFAYCTGLKTLLIPETVTEIYLDAIPTSTILIVYENSYAHSFAVEHDLLYFVLQKVENPQISYGTEISGSVTYADGSAAVGAVVEILYDDGTLKESVVTDRNGTYVFTYAEVGRYTVRVTDAQGNTASETVSVKRMNAFDVFLAGDTALTVKKSYTVSGIVENADKATVMLTDMEGKVLISAATENGSFVLERVPNGTYVLKAETETGSASQEITVFNGDLSDLTLRIDAASATVWGYASVQDRDKQNHRRIWIEVTLYNAEGLAVAQTKTDKDGMYQFKHLPLGEYTVVAETEEMRPDHHGGKYDRSYQLTGYAYVNVTEAISYELADIVLYESNDHLADLSGKVTAHGQTQKGEVILQNVFHHEIAVCKTNNNGKFAFKNVRDGLYFLIARTESNGMGCSVIVVREGEVYGSTDITVYKADKVKDRESRFYAELGGVNEQNAGDYRERIAEEKRFYDGLSEKEKKQLSKSYVEHLNALVEWAAGCQYHVGEGVHMGQGGLAVSKDELESGSEISFTLTVTEQDTWKPNEHGVKNEKDFVHHQMKDVAGDREIHRYYEITLTKTVDGVDHEITDVLKNTDATGIFRITMTIPEEFRGYKHYSVLHVHNGETVLLTDLDDDPDTITFEVNRFSTFALTATNEELSETPEDEILSCPHNGEQNWMVETAPTGTTNGLVTLVCALCGDTVDTKEIPYLKFAGASLTLTDSMTIKYKVNQSLLTEGGYTEPYAHFVMNGSLTVVKDYTVENGQIVFAFENIAPHLMGQTIEATLYASLGETLCQSNTRNYSVKEYCYNSLTKYSADQYAELRTLLVDLLNYGAATQTYVGYETDDLVNADLSAVQAAWGTSADRELTSILDREYVVREDATVAWKGAGLTLQESVTVRFKIDASDVTDLSVRVESVGGIYTITSDQFMKTDGGYYVYFNWLTPAQLSEAIYVTVYEGDAAVSNTLRYSVESYAATKQTDGNANLVSLIRAMMRYGDATKAYVN